MSDQQPEQQPENPLATIIRGVVHKPPRIFLYGIHGIGKSTFAAAAPNPIFIPTEDGASEIDVAKFPVARSRADVLTNLRALYRQPHDFQTVVIDSADWLEDFIHLELKASYSDKELSFGKDSIKAADAVNEVLLALNHLRERRNMSVVIVAHSEIRRFDSPLTEPYDRYQPKLQARFSALLQEWADAVLFTTFDVVVKKEDAGFNKEVRRGISTGERKVYAEERPAFYAKNRYGMPVEMTLDWQKVAQHIPFFAAQEGAAAKPETK